MELENVLKKRLCKIGLHDVIVFPETVSTNDDAKDFASVAPKAWTVIIAERQTGGRGRQGKTFFSPNGGVYLSVIVDKKDIPYTALTAVALSNTIKELNVENSIKWVNDIYVGDKKVAGILCESIENAVIIGVGVNLCEPYGGFPKELNAGALNIDVTREDFIEKFLLNLKTTICECDISSALRTYRARDFLKDKEIEVTGVNESFGAKVLGIDDNFGLIVLKGDKKITLSSGVVSITVK